MNNQPETLILGATGSIGYAFTQNLLDRGLPVTILVRNRSKAANLFPNAPTLTIVEGDAQDGERLIKLATGKAFLFHGLNYPYDKWFGNMDTVTQKVIDAAAVSRATLIFPGNIYNFGLMREPIREDSRPAPCSRKGGLRVELEKMLEEAARAGRCRVLTVRLPDFWGPNVMNAGVRPVFENAPRGKSLPWLATIEVPHQAVYTVDAAEIIARLMLRPQPAAAYEVWNYGGQVFPSMRWFFGQVAQEAGKPLKTMVMGRFAIRLLGLFIPVLREVKEMLYLYENAVVMDDTKVRQAFPDFRETPLHLAIRQTLDWFAAGGQTAANRGKTAAVAS